jgi:endonuclease/exonuclease/phosphatase family metal-dependent hydrolase
MQLKTLTWNIGGGKVLAANTDPTLMASYTVDGLDDIKYLLQNELPDIITLQETHKNDSYDQVADIAKTLGYDYFVHDSTSHSHIDPSMQLGHGILSRYPIISHQTGLFNNPHISVEWEDGTQAVTFDKGYTTCELDIDGTAVSVTTLHLLPFRRFNLDVNTDAVREILGNVEASVTTTAEKWIIQGDFNINSATLREYFPMLFSVGVEEATVDDPTTPKGNTYDHILYRGFNNKKQTVLSDVLTDHYPVVTTLVRK